MTQGAPHNGLAGLRVLIVEDSYLIALELAKAVEGCGCQVLGPVASAAAAMDLLNTAPCDGALLDINLGTETAEPVADRLLEQATPFIFLSGYGSAHRFAGRLRQAPLLRKPIDDDVLRQAMIDQFTRRAPPA